MPQSKVVRETAVTALVDADATQCGFCTPGFLTTIAAFIETNVVGTFTLLEAARVVGSLDALACLAVALGAALIGLSRIVAPSTPDSHSGHW